jgi:hypothetical protein
MSDMDPEDPIPPMDEPGVTEENDGGLGGRLVEQGSEDVDDVDVEKDAVAHLVTDDDDDLSAEESAMHITDSP